MTDNICVIKLLQGIELIGDVVVDTKVKILLDCPMLITEKMNMETGYKVTMFDRFIIFSDDNFFHIKKNQILYMLPVNEEVKKYYYHSLKYGENTKNKILGDISSINYNMEQYMLEESFGVSDYVESSNTVH